ncbi:DUF4158 domain-containing protein [Amycolatopsis sp. FU40]|uniref:DUF4158 domain-containing protein n=1 Tax=Amycolatopsis sp. FU40 TaxID=2914159 RepID=UPI001F3DF029|nr:DUF4158 domain-containing protein [Amycolatopsis sp. FU40]UKD51056.1 DUF4158 domain-containing protein [Amycolatopsis sp. FU40]
MQLSTVRYAGWIIEDPLEGVPAGLVEYLAEQLRIEDPSGVEACGERELTRFGDAFLPRCWQAEM